MADKKTLRIEEFQGMAVLDSETGAKLGEVADVIVHPTEGRVLGITIKDTGGDVMALGVHEILIGADAVMAQGAATLEKWMPGTNVAETALASGEVIGTNIVTEDGRLIGKVNDVYISTETPRTFYRVAGSALQRFLGGGFFIPGDLPHAISSDGIRMIVPADTEEQAASSIDEAITRPTGYSGGAFGDMAKP